MKSAPIDPQPIFTAVDFDPFAGGELLLTAPATEAQKEIWASVQMGDDANCAYNESQSLRLRGLLDMEALRSALQELVQRHEALRTTFSPDGTTLCITASLQLEIPWVDLSDLNQQEQKTRVAGLLQQEVEQPFDLEHGPLFRAQIVRLQPQEHLVLLTAHHIICDGWSWGVFMPDLGKLYSALRQGIIPDLEEPDRFSEYALLREEEADSSDAIATEEYWLGQFSDSVPVLDFPTDRPRPSLRTFDAAREDWELDPALVTNLKQLGAKLGCSFMTTILAGFEVLLYRLTGQEDLIVGISAAGQAVGQYNLVGHCVNLLPLRSRIDGQSFSDYLRSRRSALLDAYDHQQFTFGSLVKKLELPRDPSRIPLIPIIFNIDQGLESDSLPFEGLEVEFFSNPRMSENFELFVNATELRGKLTLECQYNTNLFDADTIRCRMAEFETLLAGIVANPDQTIAKLPILPEAEQRLLAEWNSTQAAYPQDKCIHQLFEAQVERSPEAVAVVFENQQLTYQELDRRANQLAHYLQTFGVGPEVLVGICIERSLEMIVGLLGILKAGGAYVPLNPADSQERLAQMLQDSQVLVLLTRQRLKTGLPEHGVHVICLDTDWDTISQLGITSPTVQEVSQNPANGAPNNLAYVIHTSGSTGKPKGVQIQHRSAVNLLNSVREQPGLTDQDTLLSVTTLSFDIAVSEIFLPLSVGARLVLVSREVASDGTQLLKALTTSGATFMQPTPVTWRLLLAAGWQGSPQLKMICTGEALPRDLANQLLPKGAALWNLYGPTETTIWSTVYKVESIDGPICIGRPLANTQVYILDSHLQPVPIGVPGELHIGGEGLARGYLNRPNLTSEKFIPNLFSPEPGARLYKTGDLARYLPDGQIECLGRIDHQVKVRGFRIELGEIETTMAQHPAVEEAVVVVREDIPDEKTLIGYLVLKTVSGSDLTDAASVQHLEAWNQRWDLLYEAGLKNASPEEPPQHQILSDTAILQQLTAQNNFEEQVQEWLDQTVERILSLRPSRVMEIGCGTGQILLEIAPKCTYYLGTDYAASALQELEKQLQTSQYSLPQVALERRAADEFRLIEPASFDTVIIHSVAQYFPDVQYLLKVLENAVQALQPGGCVYIGDVQSYALLEAYHVGAQLKRSPLSMSMNKLMSIVENRVRNEDELVIDPGFFYALKHHIPAIGRVEVKLRRGHLWNETTQFHYDVFLHIKPEKTVIEPKWHDWLDENLTVADVRQVLEETQPDWYCIKRIPNARIQKEVQTLALLKADSGLKTVAEVLEVLEKLPAGVDPESLWVLGVSLPYNVDLRCSDAAKDGYFEAVFTQSQGEARTVVIHSETANQVMPRSWSAYANSPMLKQAANNQLIPLRQFLKQRLPDYMVPATLVTLNAMPLTPNGKVDRKALPMPDSARPELEESYVAPRTALQQQIADIWAQVLNLGRVGIHDNFFELGGHSLLAIQVISRLRQTLQVELPLPSLFEVPTVANLSDRVETLLWAVQLPAPQSDTIGDYEEGEI